MAVTGDDFTSERHFIEKINSIAEERGMKGLDDYITHDLEEWKYVPINIAVIGKSGSGKSAFINAVRGLHMTDENAAKEDVIECTSEPTSYAHPNNPRFKLWDLPGTGTKRQKADSYVKDMDFARYDFFIIISADRFTEIDFDLIKELTTLKKPFFFARTKIDQDVQNDMFCKQEKHNCEDLLKKIRKNCKDNLKAMSGCRQKVYLLNNHNHKDYDLEELELDLLETAPEEKHEAMILSMSNELENVIKAKVKTLKHRTLKVAMKATIATNVLGASIVINENVVLKEVQLYQRQLGLDDSSLQHSSKTLDMSLTQMRLLLGIVVLTSENIKSIFQTLKSVTSGKLMAILSAIVWLGNSTYSCNSTYIELNKILDTMEKEALKLNALLRNKARGSSKLLTEKVQKPLLSPRENVQGSSKSLTEKSIGASEFIKENTQDSSVSLIGTSRGSSQSTTEVIKQTESRTERDLESSNSRGDSAHALKSARVTEEFTPACSMM